MDNRFTRKEEKCPLLDNYCVQEHKNCDRCISEEEYYQQEFSMEEVYADIIRSQH